MNLAEAAQLILTLQLKDEVSAGLKGIQGQLDRTGTKASGLRSGLGKIGTGIGVGIGNAARLGGLGLAALWTQVDAGIDSLVELEDVTNQTRATIKSTGGAAGLTAEDIRDLANRLEDLSGVDDKVVESGADVLLTFKNIGYDAFEPAMQAALDMSQAMDQDLQSSIVQIGKALNDPVTGLASLSRVGVTFDDATKKMIEDMVAMGDTAGAQQIIIEELNSEFGGSAQASMEGYRGTQLRLKDTWEDLQQTLAQALLPALDNLARTLKDKLADPVVKEGVRKLGEGLAGLFSPENVKGGGEALKGLFTFLRELPWNTIRDGMSFAAKNAKKVVDVFRSLPPGVQAGLLTFLAANKLSGGLIASGLGELAKVALSSLKTITAGNVTVIGANVTSPGGGGIPGVPGAVPAAGAALGAGTIAAGVAIGSVAVVAGISGLAALMNQQKLATGLTTQQVNLLNDITTLQQTRSHATTKAAADGITARIGVLQGQIVQIGIGAHSTQERMENDLVQVRDRTDHQTQVITGFGADHRSALHDIYAQALEQKRLAQIGNLSASEAKERLASIQISSQRTAQKDLSVNVTTNVSLNVSGQRIADAIDHFRRTQGGQV